jgi:carbamoyltransferase
MNILGINQVTGVLAWMHDSAAALVQDGKITAAAEEERFNRVRHARGFPKLAIDFCLKEGGITPKELDVIAVSYNPWSFIQRGRINLWPANIGRDIANIFIFKLYLQMWKKQHNCTARVMYIDHHLAHAASAYRAAQYPDANVFVIDGSGETESYSFFHGVGPVLTRVWDIPLRGFFSKGKTHSIGLMYTAVSDLLGMGVGGEGKTMGLASYGKPTYSFADLLSAQSPKNVVINIPLMRKRFAHLRRSPKAEITQEHKNLAASLQHALEEMLVNLAHTGFKKTGSRNIAVAGGVALNCNTNTRILEQEWCDSLFIQPAASDPGAALGAALEASYLVGKTPNQKYIHAYLGRGFTEDEVESLLKESQAVYTRPESISDATAALITEGKIVGWCQGRAEFGPRALGARSILADPTRVGMDVKVNEQVKHRESWRPFAPAVTEESATTYFEGIEKLRESPFMLHVFYVKEAFRKLLPAITHIDGSARIQTVRREQNALFYDLLKAVEKRNGHPVVMNTSFNDNGEPIVCTPRDAVRCYFSTGLDALAIGPFLLVKEGKRA